MSYRAMFSYAWDLAEAGVAEATREFRGLGLDTVTLAGSYHAGKFMRPRGRTGKVYFPEDGTVYFRTDPALYGTIKPLSNSLLRERDLFRELTDHGEMAVNAWLVLLHNSPLGMAHPEAVVRNAFGDPYHYNLCPSAPEVRHYAVALARDVTENYPVSGISLESPGFTPFAHGYHHEFALMKTNSWLENQLGLCFCDHCVRGAESQDLDARQLQARVVADISAYLESDVDYPENMAEAFWRADLLENEELRRYLAFRCGVVTSLVGEIRAAVRPDATVAVIPSVARPTAGCWYEGSDLEALARTAGTIEACFYEPSPDRVKADLFDIRRRIKGEGRLRGILRPAHPDLQTEEALRAAVQALQSGGVEEIAFYNWGHLRRHNLTWIGRVLNQLPGGTA